LSFVVLLTLDLLVYSIQATAAVMLQTMNATTGNSQPSRIDRLFDFPFTVTPFLSASRYLLCCCYIIMEISHIVRYQNCTIHVHV